jgi:hypothetical protein
MQLIFIWSPLLFYPSPFSVYIKASLLELRTYPRNCFITDRMATFKTFVIAFVFTLVQITSASAVKRWGVPLPACVPTTPFVYAGCFSDTGNPGALSYRTDLDFTNMTVEACVDYCKGDKRVLG